MRYRSSFGPYTINPVVFKERIYIYDCFALVVWIVFIYAFFGFWKSLKEHGMKTEVDISRVFR